MATKTKTGFQIGDPVSFLLGGRPVEGLIVEDRGPLGAGGKHLYRLIISIPPEEVVSFEMPEDHLDLQAACRNLFTEVANRVIQRWGSMPIGGPLDHLSGYQALGKAVFDACVEVAERVRAEGAAVVRALGLDSTPITSSRGNAAAQEHALRVSQHAREHGLEGLHAEIVRALWDAAAAEREQMLRIARGLDWREFEGAVRGAGQRASQYPLLALLTDSPLEIAR